MVLQLGAGSYLSAGRERGDVYNRPPVEHTLARLLELQKTQGLEISKEDMAAYLCITIRSLNRALKKLKA
jgi:CRP-like cAMP-binding protein